MTAALTRDGMVSVAAVCEAHTLRPVDTVRSTLPEILAWAADNHVTLKKGDKLAQVNARRVEEGLPPFEDTLVTTPAAPAVRHRPIVADEEELLDLVLHHKGTLTGLVTPRIASWLLRLNEGNRPLKKGGVGRFRDILRSGNWMNTGEPVIVSDAGLLNDGQHRLLAIRETGIAAEMDVRFGTARAAFQVTGTGHKRSAADALHILGRTCGPTQAAIARLVFLHDNGTIGATGGMAIEISDVVRTAEANPLIADMAKFIQQLRFRPTRASQFGFALFLAARVAPLELVYRFGTLVSTGLAQDETEPPHVLHVRLRDALLNKRKMTQVEIAALTVRSWNYWVKGRPLKHLQLMPSDTLKGGFPEAEAPADGGA